MLYTVIGEFIMARGDHALHVRKIGSTVELTATEATELIAAGKVAATGTAAPATAAATPNEGQGEGGAPSDEAPAAPLARAHRHSREAGES